MRRSSRELVENNGNSENYAPARIPGHQQDYVSILNYLASHRSAQILTAADINNGYTLAQVAPLSRIPGRADWMSGVKTGYFAAAASQQNFSYLAVAAAQSPIASSYVTSFPDGYMMLPEQSPVDLEADILRNQEIRSRKLYEEAVEAHNERVDKLLHEAGFVNRVDIKKGVTASVAVFEYVGDDPEIKSICRCGYVMVKVPPYTASNSSVNSFELPPQTFTQLHAEMTYNNEFNLISQMNPKSHDGSRPDVLARVFDGQKIILNSPVFYDEREFMRVYSSIINGEYLSLFSSSDSYDEDSSDNDAEVENAKRSAITGLLQQSFMNLQCRMRRLANSNENPARVILPILASLLNSINRIHNSGFVHSDIAARNVIVMWNNESLLCDFGVGDTINKVKGGARSNIKYPQTSIMHNNDALKEDHLIGVVTDYISYQKTILEALAYFLDVDFYKITIANLPNAPETICIEFLLQFSDRQILDNVKNNLMAAATELMQQGDRRGAQALELIQLLEPYLAHDHNPKHTFKELQAANTASFYNCVKSSYSVKPTVETRARVNEYNSHVVAAQAPVAADPAPPRMSRANTADKVNFFLSRSRANSLSAAGVSPRNEKSDAGTSPRIKQ